MTKVPKITRTTSSQVDSEKKWKPVKGTALEKVLNAKANLSSDEKEKLIQETVSILSDCVTPSASRDINAGLIIGYVQSGKTLSFTSLAALARDNQYQLVILLAGTTNNLVEQSYSRLKSDLDTVGAREWKLFTTRSKAFQKDEVDLVNNELQRWQRRKHRARTIVIVSMKQHGHLKNLTALLANSDFSGVPTLIVDDEGDQAGINTKAKKGGESTTYARIKALRDLFPHHSYILYTATPQAPLLANRIDILSPDFGHVLTPGKRYVGGQEFFVEGSDKYVKLIPLSDVPNKSNPLQEAPETLKAALRDFFIGVAIGLLEEDEPSKDSNRSMMIHPSIKKGEHLMFARWIRSLRDYWVSILCDEGSPERPHLIEQFKNSAEGIFHTYSTKHSFNEIASILCEAMEYTMIKELNTRQNNRIALVDWNLEYSWILVGGIGLDRGFTVEGLTVSYMPRSTGVGNADNIQQRGRFFGYKKDCLGLCRLYLTRENIDAFTDYVEHEESIRDSIDTHLQSGKTLKEWRRTYRLNQSLKPTRSSVILLEMYKSKGRNGWFVPDQPFYDTEIVAENREIARLISKKFEFERYARKGWNDKQAIPEFSDSIKLAEIMPFIDQFRYKWPDDGLQHEELMLNFKNMVDKDPAMICHYYAFSGPWSGTSSLRTLDDNEPPKIKNLFQGSNKRTNYPGARKIISAKNVTFQLHRYDIQTADKEQKFPDVPVLAVYIPEQLMERFWIER